ncbi:hypothetical protein HMPREF1199_00310 [Hoylesella oralis CC98A]|nr:hypothetical protein HMPREF1199_00310 [Hoylesella oralis CC98A]
MTKRTKKIKNMCFITIYYYPHNLLLITKYNYFINDSMTGKWQKFSAYRTILSKILLFYNNDMHRYRNRYSTPKIIV